MPAEFSRTQRLGEQIKRDLALLIQRELKDPRIGMVTVNFVDLSKDLSYADVNITVLVADDSDEKIIESLTILNEASTFLANGTWSSAESSQGASSQISLR